MTTSRLRALAALTVAAFAAACGSSDGGPSFATAADSATITTLSNEAGDLAQSSLYSVFGSQGYGFPLPAPGAASASRPQTFARNYVQRVRHLVELEHSAPLPARPAFSPSFTAPFSTCTPAETGVDNLGNPVDTDADGIPDDYKINFGSACVSEDSAGTYRVTFSGSIRIQDTGLGFFSFKITVSSIKIKQENLTTGDSFTETLNGSEAGQFAAALASHTMVLGLGVTGVNGGTTVSIKEDASETSSFDPDGAGTLTAGGALPAGAFDYAADLKVIGENSGGQIPGNFHFVLATTTPLHFNPACISDIDAGVFRGLLNGESTVGFTLTWSSCANPVLVIFGDTPATVAAR